MFIFLDESGNLGFNFSSSKTSRYLIIGVLVCSDNASRLSIVKAVKKTLRHKLPQTKIELKGSHLTIEIKKYFLRKLKNDCNNWSLYVGVADKKTNIRIRHCDSQLEAGLQAIDLFCSGISRKYEMGDLSWYNEFSDKIAVEVEYKF